MRHPRMGITGQLIPRRTDQEELAALDRPFLWSFKVLELDMSLDLGRW